ncbi:MAG: hypothetical protein DRP71_09650 [Verrucomicrobia bacterium]|nr:MAG: hypothetical protein DRP71_09650 [Verrucomicrobiota bacterium]
MPEKKADESSSPFHQARLRGWDVGRIRRLRGFLKGVHREPDRHSQATEAFTRKAGSPDLEDRAEQLHRDIRTAFHLKRKGLSFSCEEGTGIIKTPDFTVTLWIDQDPDDARSYRIGTEVAAITSREVVTRACFIEIFRHYCDSVLIEFTQTIDLEGTIDRIEDSDKLAPLLDYAADASWLTLKAPGTSIEMRLLPHQVSFSIPSGGDLRVLIDGTSDLLEDLNEAGAGLFLNPD